MSAGVARGAMVRRRKPRHFGTRIWLWPILLIPVLVWAAYAVGTPWQEAAPVNASWETFGEPLDLQTVRSDVRWRHDLLIKETSLQQGAASSGFHELSGPLLVAQADFDGEPATLYLYPDEASVEEDWWYWDGELEPRGSFVEDVSFTRIKNIVVVESGWLGPGTLGETLHAMHQ